MKQTEIIIGIAILLLMLLKLLFVFPYSALLITLLILILSIIYLALSFGLLNQIRFRNLFKKESYKGISTLRILGTIVIGFVLSLISIGVLFKFQLWPYGSFNLLVGIASLIPIFAVVIFKFAQHKNSLYKTLFIRLSIFLFIGILFLLTKPETLLEIHYKGYPEYIEAEKNAMNDPENKELQQKADEERLKMNSEK